MNAQAMFLEQHDFIPGAVDGFVLGGLSDEQLRRHPGVGQTSLAWLLWHAARWEDVVANASLAGRPQVLDEGDWLRRLDLPDRHVGTATTADACRALSARQDLSGLRAYWSAVAERTREVVAALRGEELGAVVDAAGLARATADGARGNARAPWLDQFFADRTKAWFLAFLNVHNAEHLVGEALCLRSQAGVPLGL